MCKPILVALDRSPLAGDLASVAADTARGAQATLRLLHVAENAQSQIDADGRVLAFADQEAARLEAEGLDFLCGLAQGLGGVEAQCAVRFGDPVTEILAEADAVGAGLIAVATAGRSAIRRELLGSVAEAVLRKAAVPVMLLRPGPPQAA